MANRDQIELAKETLNVFADRGEDFGDARHVLHFMDGGNFEALGASLRELGYAVKPTVNADGIIAERHEAIGEEWRTTTLAALCDLCDSYGVEYDGWEAAMMRQPPAPEPSKPIGFFPKIFGKKK
ncbi:ribonuclease E inhibitor RraB [Sphingobium yanoikuyae]|jgi:hypothetical protein|uniref:Ribonuclease E inhibitor RraB n=1 Tax=Sphingobium yanoikuyae TaxID=13690 RepID=A0A0J9D3E9_SPHYA|nr:MULTISPECIES: hypothetical protein [Sphingobium]ATP18907.1 hypothetical protein BV87_11170 [Sphingobium yanoikuyae]KMW31689.1 hypothetical protein BV87_22990 [Sphingobium yanoikuyae]MDH2131720.1 ribonuclease E inhibitor RraB [Sphingobium yanoikuyae]MDH2149479.1 ribonuclease E inhibitor RraB [Sphingobium yanoikuyae]MDH2166877.1 ribonuclease E inhibitor RraB [Sphingobium yanoikuyae]